MDKLAARGVITGFGPDVEPAQMGYPVLAFVSLEIVQGRLEEAVAGLEKVPEVLEVHGVTGDRDLLCRVVARDNTHLQDVINAMLHTGAVAALDERDLDDAPDPLQDRAADRRGRHRPVGEDHHRLGVGQAPVRLAQQRGDLVAALVVGARAGRVPVGARPARGSTIVASISPNGMTATRTISTRP